MKKKEGKKEGGKEGRKEAETKKKKEKRKKNQPTKPPNNVYYTAQNLNSSVVEDPNHVAHSRVVFFCLYWVTVLQIVQ